MVGRFGSGIWTPCLSRGPDIDDSSNSLMVRTSHHYLPTLSTKKSNQWAYGLTAPWGRLSEM